MTAAATTGPNSEPRPTSSTPATCMAPVAHARFSNFSVQRSFFRSRSLAAEAEILSALESFDEREDLDTEADQHLRRSRRANASAAFAVRRSVCVVAGLRPAGTGHSPVTTRQHHTRISQQNLLLFDFLQACGFALEAAQIVELGATDFRRANDVNLVDDLGVERKNALHALTEADLAHGKARLRAARPGNHDAFERLQAFFFAFPDLDQHLDRIAGAKFRQVGAAGFRQQFFNNRIAHNFPFLHQSSVDTGLAPPLSVASLISASNARSSAVSATRCNKSGRLRSVFAKAVLRRQLRICSWFPFTSTSGTAIPRNSAGRV